MGMDILRDVLDGILVGYNLCSRSKGGIRVVVSWKRRQLSSLGNSEGTVSSFLYGESHGGKRSSANAFNVDPVSLIVPCFDWKMRTVACWRKMSPYQIDWPQPWENRDKWIAYARSMIEHNHLPTHWLLLAMDSAEWTR